MTGRLAAWGVVCCMLLLSWAARAEDAASCQPDKLASRYPALVGKTVHVGQDGVSMPFSYHDPDDPDRIIGLDADYARAVFACIGVPVVFDIGAWSGLLPAVAAGRIDVVWDDLYYTPERAQRVDYVMYMAASDTAVIHKGNPKSVHSLDDLCGLRALAGLGTVEALLLNSLTQKCTERGKPGIEIGTYQDRSMAWPMIETDRTDVVLSSSAMGAAAIAARSASLQPGFDFLPDIKVGVGVAKGNKDLARAIADSMAALRTSGQAAKIFASYKQDPQLMVPPDILTR
jgi:polar amino acid transport system substrate-binding protein